MRGGGALLLVGFVVLVFGLLALVSDPPRVDVRWQTIHVPVTSFDIVPPGRNEWWGTLTVGKGSFDLALPGRKVAVVSVNSAEEVNCSPSNLRLEVRLEGYFKAVEDGHINIALLARENGEVVTIDKLNVTLKPSAVAITGTTTVVTLKPGEPVTELPEVSPTSYVVEGERGLLEATVFKPEEDLMGVVIEAAGINLSTSTTEVVVEAVGDAEGLLHGWANVKCPCVITYYLDRPEYIPKTTFEDIGIPDHYLDPGSLAPAIALITVGLAIMMISCQASH